MSHPSVETVVAETKLGSLRGRKSSRGLVFRGIRYAKAPTGERRFRPPEGVDPWDGEYDATQYGASAPQPAAMGEVPMAPEPMDEDCLFLNITTPAVDDARRPVLFWIHGGGYVTGSGRVYNGGAFTAEHDVVVVTINYRMGALGFMHVGHLDESLPASVNNGILDQICALEWTRDHIDSFGGDPDNVLVFGESAGGTSTACILGAPRADGLYHKAVLHSPHADLIEVGPGHEAFANRCIERLGGDPSTNGMATLRAASVEDLIALNDPDPEKTFTPSLALRTAESVGFSPAIDGELIPRAIADTVRSRGSANVPIMGGGCRHEGTLFSNIVGRKDADEAQAIRIFAESGVDGERAMAVYEAFAPGSTPNEKLVYALADTMFRNSTVRILDAAAQAGGDVFSWMCAYENPDDTLGFRATHAIELPFIWNWIGNPGGVPTMAGPNAPADLGVAMRAYWVAFAKDGAPRAAGEPDWPRYATTSRSTLILDTERSIQNDYDGEVRRFWFE